MFKVSEENIQENHQRITYLRILVLFCLAGIGVGGGYLVYYLLNEMEHQVCELQFSSVADLLQASITTNFETKVMISHEVAQVFGAYCPDENTWPNCKYDLTWLDYVMKDSGGGTPTFGISPFVHPERISSFENFTKHLFKSDSRYVPGTGYSSFGFGIFGINKLLSTPDQRYHDTTGVTTYGSPHEITVPVAWADAAHRSTTFPRAALFNLHSEESRGSAIDVLLNCARSSSHAANETCYRSSLTSMIQLIVDDPLNRCTGIYTPIFPLFNQSLMVGISYVYVYWHEVMNITIPPSIPEITVVVKTNTSTISYASVGTSSISYSFKNGKVVPLGDGDQHRSSYYHMKSSRVFFSKYVDPASALYEIVIYPTPSFCDYYKTSSPILVYVGLICMMIITSLLFGLYDYLMKSETLLRKFLLESKRLFVRFISHELRTPLNAVSLGLNLIESDLMSIMSQSRQSESMSVELSEQLHGCVQSVRDANENTNAAILVLNDLLQYDKIETKSLQCECIENNVWDIIRQVCRELSLQARANQVELTIKLQVDFPETDEIWRVNPPGAQNRLKNSVVIGDPVKLSQVVRNLISNALKFSPMGSEVVVHGKDLVSFKFTKV